ncbi:hypothetical protein LY76DRAFT_662255 [Colletotrichum caudatum]|nr:hypothetical protein LY76DRAFT_662255 [Colletotrichum caudatum]
MGTNKRTRNNAQDADDQRDVSPKRTKLDASDLKQAPSRGEKEALAELTRDAYAVGWICALPVEQAAAVAMLHIKHECTLVHEDDTSSYSLGRIGLHNVAIAPCMSSHGSMVGIGGGAPARNHVRRGDIVVSHPTATSTGVEPYNSGKTEKGGLFKQTGKLNKPLQELPTAVAVLKAHHESRPSQIPAILGGLKEQNLRIAYPGVEHDRLFETDYEHQGRSCTYCDPSRLVKRGARPGNNPRVHYGAIASENQVMKHGKTRDRIADELNVLCFGMEAARLMDNFPCLVIRGICHYADSHKAKEWQPDAAAVTAAYANELLLITHTHCTSFSKTYQTYSHLTTEKEMVLPVKDDVAEVGVDAGFGRPSHSAMYHDDLPTEQQQQQKKKSIE